MSASAPTERVSSRKKADGSASEPSETRSLVFEWPLFGLRQMFDGSKSDTKSKVVKSVPFGGGRWTVLFYAQSGHEQFCSLYLNAEPLAHERVRPLIAGGQSPAMNEAREAAAGGSGSSKSKGGADGDDKWSREGLFRFTFEIQPLDKSGATKLGTKEAHDHAFSHKTSNWGWAQFAKRDTVYYSQPAVKQADGFLISVTITANAERPRPRAPVYHTVPPVLISAMGSLLDDPEHSDVVFHIAQPRGRSGRRAVPKKIYAIKKILASRSEYFADMFNGGFAEAERAEDSEEEMEDGGGAGLLLRSRSPLDNAHPQGAPEFGRGAATQYGERAEVEADDYERGPEALLEDSDEELDDDADCWSLATPPPASSMAGGATAPAAGDGGHKSGAGDMSDDDEEEEDEADDDRPVEDDVIQFGGAGKSGSGGGDAGISSNMHSPLGGADGELAVSSDQGRSGNWTAVTAEGASAAAASPGGRTPAKQQRLASTSLQVTGDRAMAGSATPSRLAAGAASSAHAEGVTRALLQQSGSAKRDRPDGATSRTRSASDRRKRRKVVVRDSSYATFKALLFFLYTNAIEFAPLTSSFLPPDVSDDASSDNTPALPTAAAAGREASSRGGFLEEIVRAHKKRQMVIDQYCAEHPDKPAPCSAKAMYKLADKLQIEDLKKRAQEHIASSLTVQNIVWEAFSGFNAQYPDIMHMEIDFLLKHWASVKKATVMQTIFTRPTAHPGLAYVWPLVLQHLSVNADEEAAAEDSRAVITL